MRTTLISIFVLLTGMVLISEKSFAQGRFLFGYDLFHTQVPIRSEMPKMTPVYGPFGGFHLGYQVSKKFPLSIEAQYQYGFYDKFNSRSINHTMVFASGGSEVVPISYDHTFNSYNFGIRYQFMTDKRFSPFIYGYVGNAAFKTRILIENEMDYDDCAPLWSRMIAKDNTPVYGIRLGLEYRFTPGGLSGIFISAGYMGSSGTLSYANAPFMDNKPRQAIAHNEISAQRHSSGPDTQNIYADFINLFSSDVHAHKVGELYTSRLRMLDFRLGLNIRL